MATASSGVLGQGAARLLGHPISIRRTASPILQVVHEYPLKPLLLASVTDAGDQAGSVVDGVWTRTDQPPSTPAPELRYRPKLNLIMKLRELWHDRHMIRSLAEREMRARYKQTFLGIAWAVITPFLLMIVFTLFFKRAVRVDTEGAGYPLFSYLGLLPWGFFSTGVSQGSVSLIANVPLLNKVYCPREVFPLGSIVLAIVDTTIAFTALLVLFVVEGTAPKGTAVYAPLYLPMLFAFTVGTVLIMSSVMVYLRDLRTTLPLALQLGLFATPIAYSLDSVPEHLRTLYVGVNPLVTVIDGLRRTVLFDEGPNWQYFGISSATSMTVLVFGYWIFKRLEGGIADVA